MQERSTARRPSKPGVLERPAFLQTHRGVAAGQREFAKLVAEITNGIGALERAGRTEKPVFKQSPGRTIVQLGPVALTVAWHRNTTVASAAEGELLVMYWRGAVVGRSTATPERQLPPQAAAMVVAEEVFVAAAESESDWHWRPSTADGTLRTSAELAEHCVRRLVQEYGQPTH